MELRSKSKCLLPTPPVHSAALKPDCRAGCPNSAKKKKLECPAKGKNRMIKRVKWLLGKQKEKQIKVLCLGKRWLKGKHKRGLENQECWGTWPGNVCNCFSREEMHLEKNYAVLSHDSQWNVKVLSTWFGGQKYSIEKEIIKSRKRGDQKFSRGSSGSGNP